MPSNWRLLAALETGNPLDHWPDVFAEEYLVGVGRLAVKEGTGKDPILLSAVRRVPAPQT
jgi:hypothetical protein